MRQVVVQRVVAAAVSSIVVALWGVVNGITKIITTPAVIALLGIGQACKACRKPEKGGGGGGDSHVGGSWWWLGWVEFLFEEVEVEWSEWRVKGGLCV